MDTGSICYPTKHRTHVVFPHLTGWSRIHHLRTSAGAGAGPGADPQAHQCRLGEGEVRPPSWQQTRGRSRVPLTGHAAAGRQCPAQGTPTRTTRVTQVTRLIVGATSGAFKAEGGGRSLLGEARGSQPCLRVGACAGFSRLPVSLLLPL